MSFAPASVTSQDHLVDISGYSVSPRSCVIHFYYTRPEQERLLGFLRDGVTRGEGVVMACTAEAYDSFAAGLEMLGLRLPGHEIAAIEITRNLQASIDTIASAAKHALARHRGHFGRVLCDFGSAVGQEAIFEVEGSLNFALAGLDLVLVTQYDGRGFGAPITIEQFQTHALAIVGTAFFRENRHYTPPETYFRKRAASNRA